MQRAEAWALLAARPVTLLARLTAPAIWLLSHATDLTVRLFGGDPDRDRQEVTEEEIRDLIAAQRSYTAEQRQIIDGALEVAIRTLRQIALPPLPCGRARGRSAGRRRPCASGGRRA